MAFFGSEYVDLNADEVEEIEFSESDNLFPSPAQNTTSNITPQSGFSFGGTQNQPSTSTPSGYPTPSLFGSSNTNAFGSVPTNNTSPFGNAPRNNPFYPSNNPPQVQSTSHRNSAFSASPQPHSFGYNAAPPQQQMFGMIPQQHVPAPQLYQQPLQQQYIPPPQNFMSQQPQSAPQFGARKKKQKFRKATTNVISINLGTLSDDVKVATGDPTFCTKCNVAYSSLDTQPEEQTTTSEKEMKEDGEEGVENMETEKEEKKEEEDDDEIDWECSFCGQRNKVFLDPEELPTSPTMDYILEVPAKTTTKKSIDDKAYIFVIDISGSMCVTTELQGKHTLKGSESGLSQSQAFNVDNASQFTPNENRNVTYVSRLQSVKAAVSSQIEKMMKEAPNRYVGLITFNNEVTIVGDGTTNAKVITGDILNDYDKLLEISQNSSQLLSKNVGEAGKNLVAKLFQLNETGATALGPALVAACGLAGKIRGSEIVVCTDGKSNVGLGQLDDLKTEQEETTSEEFYEKVANYCVDKGVIVSVIGIKGDDCRIENLGVLTEKTNGEVNVVDPLNVVKEFSSILSQPVIATNTSVKVHLHKGLFVRQHGTTSEKKSSSLLKVIGNVTKESAFTIEYGVRAKDELESQGINVKELSKLPFQIQIEYTRPNGMKCMRVIAKEQRATFDKAKAEEKANVDVIGLNAMQGSAGIAQQGQYNAARFNNFSHQSLMQRVATKSNQQDRYEVWASKGQQLEEATRGVQITEQQQGLFLDDLSSSTSNVQQQQQQQRMRKNRRGDSYANLLWNLKSKRNK